MDEITSKYHSVDFREPRRLRILVNWPVKARMSSLVSVEDTGSAVSDIKVSNRCSGPSAFRHGGFQLFVFFDPRFSKIRM
jgi:hypothetical protein